MLLSGKQFADLNKMLCNVMSNQGPRLLFVKVCLFFTVLQIFNAARQLSHIEAAPDKSGLVLLDYWAGLKRCLVIIHN